MYVAGAEPSALSAQQFAGIPVHPGEDASAKESDDWWRQFSNVLTSSDAAYFIASRTPPRLVSLDPIDLSGYTTITVPAVGTKLNDHLAAVEHNRKVAAATAENARRKAVLIDHKTRSATALAAALDAALRPKAASLLLRLQKAHRDVAASSSLGADVYDGHAFVKTMRNEKKGTSAPAMNRSYQWHEAQYRSMLLSKLPDGCSSQDYADKCNDLLTNHLPYFKTIRLEGEFLSETYLEFLPESLKGVAAGIEDDMREKDTFKDPDAVMARAKRNVGKLADASAEHARLACAVGGVAMRPKLPAVAPSHVAPSAAGGSAGESEALKRIEKALAAVMAKSGVANDASHRVKKNAERVQRNRLPDDKWCKSGTCQYNHDEKHPGKPCYSDPRVEVTISYEASQIKGYKGRLEERRSVQGKKLGVTPKPVKIAPKGAAAAPANPVVPAPAPAGSFDGLDDWGHGAMSIGDIASGAAPANPVLPDGTRVAEAPTVQGTPVFYSLDELRDALESDDDVDDDAEDDAYDGRDSHLESDDEDAGRVVSATWGPPASAADIETHSPVSKSWWLIEPPDKAYRAVREFGFEEWGVFDAAGYVLREFGPGASGEVNAHAALTAANAAAAEAELCASAAPLLSPGPASTDKSPGPPAAAAGLANAADYPSLSGESPPSGEWASLKVETSTSWWVVSGARGSDTDGVWST